MEYSTESIRSFKTVVSKNECSKYDWDIIVPDYKPDVAKIIATDCKLQITSKEIMQERAMIGGNAIINILYSPVDFPGIIKCVETTQPFSMVIELPGLRQTMSLNVVPSCTDISVSILNSRKLHISSEISVFAVVTDISELNYMCNINSDDILCKTKEFSTYRAISETENIINLSEEIEVPMGKPSINEILKMDVKICEKNVKAINNKFVVKGELSVTTVYNSEIEGAEIEYMCHNIPFTEIFDVPDINENSVCDADIIIKNINYLPQEDREGEKRSVLLDISILIQSRNCEMVTFCPVIDAYSTGYDLKCEKSCYNFDEIINKTDGYFNIKETAVFNCNDIMKVIDMSVDEDINKVSAGENCIKTEGKLNVNILYISSENSEIKSAKASIPFNHIIDCYGACDGVICDLKTEISKSAYNILSDNELELRVNVEYTAVIKKESLNELICNMTLSEDKIYKDNKSYISIYFYNDKEDLWEIAKKYKTTVDNILSINKITEEGEIKKGRKLLIP
jgi:hypothetical protein